MGGEIIHTPILFILYYPYWCMGGEIIHTPIMEKGEGSDVANLIVLVIIKSNQPLHSIAGGGRPDNRFKIQNTDQA